MKKMKILCVALLCMMFAATAFAQKDAPEQLTVPLSSPGKPYSLKVQLVQGSIKVVSYEGKDIVINVSSAENEDDESAVSENGMKRISRHDSYEITAKELDNTVTVNAGNPSKSINLDLKIPQDVKLKLGTVNNGEIVVDNVKGELEVNNVNDKITLTNISGSVVANTVNGDVEVTIKSVDPKAPMAFSTLNGDVRVTLPADTKANLKLKSDNGDILSDFDIDIDKTQPKVDKTSEPGMYKLKKDDWVYGKINGGGVEMMMKNMQGDIYVKKGGK
jgi:hypothetical protein